MKEMGRQVYLGGYEHEEHAAEAYDVAALKCKGTRVKTNFATSRWESLSFRFRIRLHQAFCKPCRQEHCKGACPCMLTCIAAHVIQCGRSSVGILNMFGIYFASGMKMGIHLCLQFVDLCHSIMHDVHRYTDLTECMDSISLEELIMAVRRQSQGFSRGTSTFRGVTHHPSRAPPPLI